jgi:hypothetical protein
MIKNKREMLWSIFNVNLLTNIHLLLPDNNPIPFVDSVLENVPGQGHLALFELLLKARELNLFLIDITICA